MFKIYLSCCLFLVTISLLKAQAPLTPGQEKEILQIFLVPQRDEEDPLPHEKVAKWAEAQELADELISGFIVKLFQDLFHGGKFDEEPLSSRICYGRNVLLILERFRPGDEDAKTMLKDVIEHNYFDLAEIAAFVYGKIFVSGLGDDAYIHQKMTIGSQFSEDIRENFLFVLIEQYDNSEQEAKLKIVNRIFDWAQHPENSSALLQVDLFLLKHRDQYERSPERMQILTNALQIAATDKLPVDTAYYRHIKSAFDQLCEHFQPPATD